VVSFNVYNQIPRQYLHFATTASFQILSSSIFTYDTIIQGYVASMLTAHSNNAEADKSHSKNRNDGSPWQTSQVEGATPHLSVTAVHGSATSFYGSGLSFRPQSWQFFYFLFLISESLPHIYRHMICLPTVIRNVKGSLISRIWFRFKNRIHGSCSHHDIVTFP
jgi:hypothetical protein